MNNQVEKATTTVQAYVSHVERQMVQRAVEAANERVAAQGGMRPYSESLWAREVLVREARRVAQKAGR